MTTRASTVAERVLLTGSQRSLGAYRAAMAIAQEIVEEHFATRPKPYSGASPEELKALLSEVEVCSEAGTELETVLRRVGALVLTHSVVVSHPTCVAHLHCPPLTPALAAEAMISAANQSMDSWDQSPAATLLEQCTVGWLCRLFGYSHASDGVFTSGGTQSNLMGLQLARDRYAQQRLGWRVQERGLPPEAGRFRVLCSEAAHFTIRRSAALLGLGEQAVVTVKTDDDHRMCLESLDRKLEELDRHDLIPIALVATAGTTDYGSIDPLPEISIRSEAYGVWLHVDAAYGGALMLSTRHRSKLEGIEASDSVAVDFHKLFYQPISCSAFLLRDGSNFDLIEHHSDYLNPETDDICGIPNLVTKSLQTTRRFDALKLFVSLRTLGRKAFAEMIDVTIDLARETSRLIAADPDLELVNQPQINAVVFRYCPTQTASPELTNQINEGIRASLLKSGEAILARTRCNGFSYLKFTLLNPRTTLGDVETILKEVKQRGRELEHELEREHDRA